MDPRLEAALRRFAKVTLFSAAAAAALAVASLNLSDPHLTAAAVLAVALQAAVTGAIAALQKFLAFNASGDPEAAALAKDAAAANAAAATPTAADAKPAEAAPTAADAKPADSAK